MRKPIIGVLGAQNSIQSAGINVKTAYANDAYCQAIIQAGGVPIILPVTADAEQADSMFKLCDGFLFPGGEDVDPRFYGEEPHRLLGTVNQLSDAFWFRAFHYAVSNSLPILGICRGMQLINVVMGGNLYQDLSEREQLSSLHLQKQNRDYLIHKIHIEKNSKLAGILGCVELYTNTMHHQSVKRIANGLQLSAQTADGVVEALENADGSIILVQWHPEELLNSEPKMCNLFTDLVQRTLAEIK